VGNGGSLEAGVSVATDASVRSRFGFSRTAPAARSPAVACVACRRPRRAPPGRSPVARVVRRAAAVGRPAPPGVGHSPARIGRAGRGSHWAQSARSGLKLPFSGSGFYTSARSRAQNALGTQRGALGAPRTATGAPRRTIAIPFFSRRGAPRLRAWRPTPVSAKVSRREAFRPRKRRQCLDCDSEDADRLVDSFQLAVDQKGGS
jgi:hypothetical protein